MNIMKINTLKQNIQQQLKDRKMSAAELERRAGVPHAVVNILHGRSKNPSIRVTQALAKQLGCSIEALMGDMPEPPPSESCINTNHPWQAELFSETVTVIQEYLKSNQLSPDISQVLKCIEEVYQYALGSPEQQVDQRFAKWLADKSFKH